MTVWSSNDIKDLAKVSVVKCLLASPQQTTTTSKLGDFLARDLDGRWPTKRNPIKGVPRMNINDMLHGDCCFDVRYEDNEYLVSLDLKQLRLQAQVATRGVSSSFERATQTSTHPKPVLHLSSLSSAPAAGPVTNIVSAAALVVQSNSNAAEPAFGTTLQELERVIPHVWPPALSCFNYLKCALARAIIHDASASTLDSNTPLLVMSKASAGWCGNRISDPDYMFEKCKSSTAIVTFIILLSCHLDSHSVSCVQFQIVVCSYIMLHAASCMSVCHPSIHAHALAGMVAVQWQNIFWRLLLVHLATLCTLE